jgi:hypothetical protein
MILLIDFVITNYKPLYLEWDTVMCQAYLPSYD